MKNNKNKYENKNGKSLDDKEISKVSGGSYTNIGDSWSTTSAYANPNPVPEEILIDCDPDVTEHPNTLFPKGKNIRNRYGNPSC